MELARGFLRRGWIINLALLAGVSAVSAQAANEYVAGRVHAALGIEEGDMIESINGERLDEMQKAFDLLLRLRSETRFRLELERGGRGLELDYEVR